MIQAIGFRLPSSVAAGYGRALGLPPGQVHLAICRAIAASPFWRERPGTLLLTDPALHFALVGAIPPEDLQRIRAHIRAYLQLLPYLLYVDYRRAEIDCTRLANQLRRLFGATALAELEFTAIPRGGHIVLGLLAYRLGLRREQVPVCPGPSPRPLVVVDDCALTGGRFGRFIKDLPERPIVFAHLYSNPGLRSAIEQAQPNVVACLSARDLPDRGPDRITDYAGWQWQRKAALVGKRYWVGATDHVCFAWNEPDILLTDPVSGELDTLWHLVPPQFCTKNRPPPGAKALRIQVQRAGRGPFRTAPGVLAADYQERLVIVQIETERVWDLSGVAADMWRLLMQCGSKSAVLEGLSHRYDAPPPVLRRDLDRFVAELMQTGLLVTIPQDECALQGTPNPHPLSGQGPPASR